MRVLRPGAGSGSTVLLLAIALGALACVAGWVLVSVETPRTPHVMSHALPSDLQSNSAAVHAALEAPLFWVSRMPVVQAEAAAEDEPETLEGVRLVGIVDDTALLKEGEAVKRVRRGEKFGGFVLEGVEGNTVVLVSPGRRVELKIAKDSSPRVMLRLLEES